MIQTEKLIPQVYYDESRDFQVLGRLLDIITNFNKMNIDIMLSSLDSNMPNQLTKLMTTLVGFIPKHNYINNDLIAVCKTFRSLINKKGSKEAIENAICLLVNNQGIKISYETIVGIDIIDKHMINLYIPNQLKDINLLEDLLDYILPAGWLYRIITVDNNTASNESAFATKDEVSINELHTNTPQIAKLDDKNQIVNKESKTYLSTVSGRQKGN